MHPYLDPAGNRALFVGTSVRKRRRMEVNETKLLLEDEGRDGRSCQHQNVSVNYRIIMDYG